MSIQPNESMTSNVTAELPDVLEQAMQNDEEEIKAYLSDTLHPLLSYALEEVEKLRPPDPVLFVAQFLLRHNPKKAAQ